MKYFENKYTRFQEIKKNAIQAVATLVTNANLTERYIKEIRRWPVYRD